MEKILVSACLLGDKVRYNGSSLTINDEELHWILTTFEVIPFCPEVASGLPIPRSPAEISTGTGSDVLTGLADVVTIDNLNIRESFVRGAHLALEKCLTHQIRYALLTDASPSCGSTKIYDGKFNGTQKNGQGVTTALLQQHGIIVVGQHNIDLLQTETAR